MSRKNRKLKREGPVQTVTVSLPVEVVEWIDEFAVRAGGKNRSGSLTRMLRGWKTYLYDTGFYGNLRLQPPPQGGFELGGEEE
jgi:hypothetical protein